MSESHPSSRVSNPSFQLPPPAEAPTRCPLGVSGLDAALGGGIARGRVHEIYAGGPAEEACAQGFALMLALGMGRTGHIVWVAERRTGSRAASLYGPGLAELGADPARLLGVTVADEAMLLKAAADVARAPAAGTLVVAPGPTPKRIDLTATRRLTLFAERSGVTVILLRGIGEQAPSAAETRWMVSAAPSTLIEGDVPGGPALRVDLVRRKGGPPSPGWRLEWDRDACGFSGAALSGGVSADDGVGLLAG